MTPAELERIARRLFGPRWKGALARALGLDNATLYRQIEQDRIPGPVASCLMAWDLILTKQDLLPPSEPGGEFRRAETVATRKLSAYAKAMLGED